MLDIEALADTWEGKLRPHEKARQHPDYWEGAKYGFVNGYSLALNETKYHNVAKNLWLLLRRMFNGGALCNEKQALLFEEARRIAHDNLLLGSPIRAKLIEVKEK